MYESRSVRRMYRRDEPVVQAGSVPSAKAAFRLRSGMPLSSAASGTVSTRRSASGTPVVVVVVVVVGIAMAGSFSSLFVTWSLYAGKRNGDDRLLARQLGNGLYRIRRRDYQRMVPPYMDYWQKAA